MKKSGVILEINKESGYAIVTGKVVSTSEGEKGGNEWYLVKLQFEDDETEKISDIWFWNDKDATDFRRFQADRAKQKNLRIGNMVTIRCRFRDDTKKEAYGYGINYSGLIHVKPDTEHEKDDRNVVVGSVTSMKDVIIKGQNALRLNVYGGKRKSASGEIIYRHIAVTLMGDLAIMARTDFAEIRTENGVIRKNGVFRCGAIHQYYLSTECPICYETTKYDQSSGKMICEECGCSFDPEEKDRRESVFAYDYFVTDEREYKGGN